MQRPLKGRARAAVRRTCSRRESCTAEARTPPRTARRRHRSLARPTFPLLAPPVQTPGIGNDCTDSGQIDGRAYVDITGCVLFGRVARVPYNPATAQLTGPVETIMDGEDNNFQGCSQFSTHGITGLGSWGEAWGEGARRGGCTRSGTHHP